MEEAKKKLLIKGVIIGGIVGSAVMAFRTKPNLGQCIKDCYSKSAEMVKFINENRSEIISQLRTTSETVTKVIDEANDDLKVITANVKHIKDSSSKMITSLKETKEHFIEMYQCCNSHKDESVKLDEKKDV